MAKIIACMTTLLMKRLYQLRCCITQAFTSPYFGFVRGHAYLSKAEIAQIRQLVGSKRCEIVHDFEEKFAEMVGPGQAVSYAAARMGFYELMRLEGVGRGDEIILLGATCSVMVNAVIRIGATPIFSDVDPETFGSSAPAVLECITPKTKMIVAQHSFGIPCDIEPIVQVAKSKKIFLLEDCALTLGSRVNGIKVGNFGNAALFSTDHSKPLNTLIGGLIYTQDLILAQRLKQAQLVYPELSNQRQKALWRRMLLEARYCIPTRYGKLFFLDLFFKLCKKITRGEDDFLCDDSGTASGRSYPYPAMLPEFLAAIGLIELQRWPDVLEQRKAALTRFRETFGVGSRSRFLPAAYANNALEIVPLRFVWTEPNGANVRKAIMNIVHVSWTWFMAPIISTSEPLENFGYRIGGCPISERIGPGMVNIPCVYDQKDTDKLISSIEKLIT